MTEIPSPFAGGGLEGDNFEEIKKTADKNGLFAIKMAREQLNRGADEYIRLVGKENVERQMAALRASIDAMNRVNGGTVRLSIPTLDAMIVAIAMVPGRVGMKVAADPKFGDLQLSLYAFKRMLKLEQDEKLKNLPPFPPVIPTS